MHLIDRQRCPRNQFFHYDATWHRLRWLGIPPSFSSRRSTAKRCSLTRTGMATTQLEILALITTGLATISRGGVLATVACTSASAIMDRKAVSSYDYGTWVDTNDIVWDSGFGAGLSWNGNGNGINFNQRLENKSSFAKTVNVPLSVAKWGRAD